MPVKIFVGNLNEDTRSDDLRPMFEKYGKVSECSVLNKYGFVHMDEEKGAEDAIDALSGVTVHGATIVVQKSHGGRGRGRGRGFFRPRGGYRGYDRDYGRSGYGYSRDYGRDSSYSSRYSSRDGYDRYSRYDSRSSDSYDRRRPYPDPYDREDRYSSYDRERRTSGGRSGSPAEYRQSSYSRSSDDYYDKRRSSGSSAPQRREYSSRDYSSREYSSRDYDRR